MKKGIFIAGIFSGVVIIAMILIPILFKGKIEQKVKLAANRSVNAKIDFTDVQLSLFRSFPQLNIALENLTVSGINEFANTPLLKVQLLSTSVNLSSLWKSDGIQITSVTLVQPTINLIVNKSGKSNWDISKGAEAGRPQTEKKSSSVNLEKIGIRGATFAFNNEATPMLFSLRNGNFDLSGAMKGNNSKLSINGQADSINFDYNGSRFASNLSATLKGGLQADFDKMSFTLLQNEFLINKLPVEAQGTFLVGEKEYNFDLTFKSSHSSFGDLLGFIPLQYQKNLRGIETRGDLSFGGFVKGVYSDATIPGLSVDLKIAGGALKYPNLPRQIEQIELIAGISKPQGSMDLTEVKVEKFTASLAGNPLSASLFLATPVSDPQVKGNIKGVIDFALLKQALPMDSVDLSGMMDAAVDFNGYYSAIEKEQYENFKTEGTVTLKNFRMASKSLPQKLEISSADILFNPKSITLKSLNGNLAQSDFAATGSLTNYWPYMLKNGILNGTLSVNSNFMNFNQLMPNAAPKDSTVSSRPAEIPENINVSIQSSVTRALYDRMTISGITGKISVKERKVILDGLNLNMLSGKVVVSGTYSTPKESVPDFDFKLDIKDFDLPTAYQSLSTIRHFLPIAGQSTGAFNSGISLTGKIGPGYGPIFSTMNGSGLINARNIELVGARLFNEIGKYFRKDLFNKVKVNDFLANFRIVDGGVAIAPFNTKVAGQDVTISGKQSVALAMDYRIDFKVNRNDLSEEVTKYIGFVPGAENISKYPIGINLGGTFDKPEVKVDLSEAKDLVEKEFKKKAGSTIQETIKKFGLDKLFK